MGIMEDNRHLEEADIRYVWHPFTQMKDWGKRRPVVIVEGRDCFIKDISGRWYLDGVSSLWVNIHGHRKKELDDALKGQIDMIAHSTMLGLSSVPAVRLAERLAGIMDSCFGPGSLNRVFYSDNGSTAVEAALKMAFQYWLHKGRPEKQGFVSLNYAYHGDTIGAMSVGGVDVFHKAFAPLLFKTHKAPSPYCYRCGLSNQGPGECGLLCLKGLEDILKARAPEIAAFIVEPLVQAAGGMIVHPPGYLRGARELCTKYGVLMIADEVATGFGRTGRLFACEHESVAPDILCLSKGITGGYMPLAVTIASEEVYDAFLGEYRELKTFFHGHSYTGNPLGCACALACLDVFEKEETVKNLAPKIALLEEWLRDVSRLPHVGDARNAGLMAGVELVKDKSKKGPYPWEEAIGWQVAWKALDGGVFIRPLGGVIVIMPPLAISEENLKRMLTVLEEAIKEATGDGGVICP